MEMLPEVLEKRPERSNKWQRVPKGDWGTQIVSAVESTGKQLLYYGLLQGPNRTGQLVLVAVMADERTKTFRGYYTELHAGATEVPSLAHELPSLLWIEKEMWEKWGLVPVGHPDLRPVLRPDLQELKGVAEGSGVFHLPLGPVRADVSESGHFLFDTLGEQIMHLETQLFWKHRGIEKLAAGRDLNYVALLAERISGTSTVAHAVAFARAAEQALGIFPGAEVEMERALFGEMERLYNHVHDMAQMASAAGMTVGQAQLSRAKEELLRLNAKVTGSRYLRGLAAPLKASGVNWQEWRHSIQKELWQIKERVDHFVDLLLRTPTFVDRYQGTGKLPVKWAKAYGVVGPVARAAGLNTDARWEILDGIYTLHGFRMAKPKSAHGDALARFQVRMEEWRNSLEMVNSFLDALNESRVSPFHQGDPSPGESLGIGVSESPRGRVVHVLRLDGREQIEFWGIRSASAWNWPVFGLVTANGNIQTDFPIIDASFGLSYAGNDR